MLKYIPILSVFLAAGCGGGGGGLVLPNVATGSNTVPFYTPIRVESIQITQTGSTAIAVADIFTKDLSGTGVENVIIAGRSVDPVKIDSRIDIFGWRGTSLINQTSTWFTGTDNIIRGSEPSIRFGDFLGNGRTGMYVAPSTDSESIRGAPGVVFINNGSSFTRINLDIGNTWAHDSVVYDFNRDGRADILTLDYGSNTSLAFSNGDSTFTVTKNTAASTLQGSSGAAVADFLGDGSTTVVATDSSTTLGEQTRLLSWSVAGSGLSFSTHSILPAPRFNLPKYAAYNTAPGNASHSVRALAFDFDNSGRTSVIVFSTPWFTNGTQPTWSEVQFLKNNGGGAFTDVTDSVLVGYDTSMPVSYNPKLIDVNGDGLTDIFLSGTAWNNPTANTQVLLHTSDHKFIASYANVFAAFENQSFNAEAVRSSAIVNLNVTNIVQGPNNELYLVSLINTVEGGVSKKVVYLSKMGTQTVTAPATLAAIRTAWPYLSAAQANEILSSTSTTWLGLNIIDPAKALSPIGNLGLIVNGVKSMFTGSLSGININNTTKTMLVDDHGRSFAVNLASATTVAANSWARTAENMIDETRGLQSLKMPFAQFDNFKFGIDSASQSLVMGLTGMKIGTNTQLSMQYTQLPFSPFVQMSGSWGSIKKSNIIETSITTKYQGTVARGGLMYTNTEINPGLVTAINPITSVWYEVGYKWNNFKLMGGMLPKVINGSASLRMPISVDTSGGLLYTTSKVNISSLSTYYARLAYDKQFNKNVSFIFNGLISNRMQTSLMSEMKIKF